MQEVRLIDANALAESDMAKLIDKYLYNQCNLTVGLAAALMPEIEAEPVRHGHWVLTRDEQYEYCHCSECGYDTGENWMIGSEIPYCAQCGSKNYDGGADNG